MSMRDKSSQRDKVKRGKNEVNQIVEGAEGIQICPI